MECGVEDRDLRKARPNFLCNVHGEQIRGIVERCQRRQCLDRFDGWLVEDRRRSEFFTSMDDPMSNRVEFGEPMARKDMRKGTQRGGNVAEGRFSGLCLSVSGDLVGTAPGFKLLVARFEDLGGCLPHFENADLQTGTAAVHYKYLHNASFSVGSAVSEDLALVSGR